MNCWKRKALALAALAQDQAGKPEGELARQMLSRMLERHPEARDAMLGVLQRRPGQTPYEPLRPFMAKDAGRLVRLGGSLEGHWEGKTPEAAFAAMIADYRQRLRRAEDRQGRLPVSATCRP